MPLALVFTVIGFLVGFGYVIWRRKIRPGKILAATFLGLLTLGIWKVFKAHYKTGGRRWSS
ncbi:MAG TPA: hypothetical protein VI976_00920 [Candidatus Omnitrophota bacterium]|nr:hypothetical protein [Candidatus Omnitrophota bacterium]